MLLEELDWVPVWPCHLLVTCVPRQVSFSDSLSYHMENILLVLRPDYTPSSSSYCSMSTAMPHLAV